MRLSRSDFPAGFQFGAATSAYQIEGTRFGGTGTSHWDTFSATPGNVLNGENGATACDHYHRWEQDLDLIRDAGFDAYRFSTSWARILPEGRGTPNAEGLDFYDRLVDGMLARGLKPFLTLYHWDLPSDLAMRGGWTNPDIAGWFTDYARVVMGRIGDRVATTATINEPWCVSWLSHFLGAHAPGLRDIRAAAHAMHHVLLAHGDTVAALRADGYRNLGLVTNFEYCGPMSDTPADHAAAAREDAIYNRWFVEGVSSGKYPEEALAGLRQWMPKGWEQEMGRVSQSIDWLGVNYYTRRLYADAPGALWPSTTGGPGPLPKTSMDWEIYPEGLEFILTRLATKQAPGLPIYITENGMSWRDELRGNRVEDPVRIDFMERHLDVVKRRIAAGDDIRGFFYWSLLDNYEWAFGYDRRFGLVYVDMDSLERHPKASYHALATALATR
ncbi:MAG TPA: GH1 family beta-glucosidase [Albidovulum sp.]|uniref:GH1 family beta-glucosidase n=1 Tax=Albidovulum sp. TaxID=1872424 RepID=UPI002C9E1E47|nr:GH1 family beta-glucosidase [Albidovulum sp.]